MTTLIYTTSKSKMTKKQRAMRDDILKEQREIKKSLKRNLGVGKFGLTDQTPFRRTTKDIPSLGNGVGNAVLIPRPEYTGNAIKGIGTMHKSNAVPIFTDEEAIDIAHMRR